MTLILKELPSTLSNYFYCVQSKKWTISALLMTLKRSFIPPYILHFGGLYETANKSAKQMLSKVSNSVFLNFEEVYTLLRSLFKIQISHSLFSWYECLYANTFPGWWPNSTTSRTFQINQSLVFSYELVSHAETSSAILELLDQRIFA